MNITRDIRLTDIKANRYQPRTSFQQDKLEELAASIKSEGLIEPIVVRKIDDGYEVIAGERRCRAAKLAGLTSVPCLVIKATEESSARMALIENIQREDLNALEEALAYNELLKLEGCTQSELAKKIGKNQSTIANKMRLLNLNDQVKDALINNDITERQARALLRISKDKQTKILNKIVKKGLDSLGTEKYVEKFLNKPASSANSQEEKGVDKFFIRDARVAINTINDALDSLSSTNLDVSKDIVEDEEGYTITIHINKV